MWNGVKRFLMVASVTVNVAFAGIWLAHAIPGSETQVDAAPSPDVAGQPWCPLHQQLDVSDQQWQQIEPRLLEFRESAQSLCQNMSRLRSEVMDLVAMDAPDREAIVVKQEEIRACQRKMQGMVIDQLLAEKDILTTEQGKKLFALLREHGSSGRGGRGGRGGHAGLRGTPEGGAGQMLRAGPEGK